jgi:serine/threonine-protein kinase RIO1
MFPNVGVLSVSILLTYDIKNLYMFFDNNGVHLNIEKISKNIWGYNISLNNGTVFGFGATKNVDRKTVETDGFTECFRILEKKLNKKQIDYM